MRFPLLTLPVLVLLLVTAFAFASAFAAPAAAAADADAQHNDARAAAAAAVPASILPRIRALERAFGIGEVARRRAQLANASASAPVNSPFLPTTLVGQQIDPATGEVVCSSQTCSSCGDLNLGSVGQNAPLVAAVTDGGSTDYYGFQMCNSSPWLQFSGGGSLYTCYAANTVFCQYHVGMTYSIADATNTPTWTYVNGLVGYYQEGASDCVQGGVPRAMQITFVCGSGADAITSVTVPSATASYCTWQVIISTPLVCDISAETLNPDANGGGGSNGESVNGWIIFAVVLTVVIALELVCMARRSL